MKKNIHSILLLLCFCAATAQAQDFYLKAGTGYAFAMPGQTRDQLGNVLNGTVITTSSSVGYRVKSASFSAGLHGTIGGGYKFTKNIGVELNADFNLVPKKYSATEMDFANSSNQSYDYSVERQAKTTILLLPSLVIQTANNAVCNLYMRLGVALPLNTGIKMRESFRYYQTGNVNQYDWKIQNYFSLGFAAATGVKIKIGENVALFGEASMLYLALLREQRDLEAFSANGVSHPLSQLTGGIKSYHYIRNGITNNAGTSQAFSQPFSNVAVSAGVSFTF